MDDFGSIVYLDVEKTGSSFVSKFLKENMKNKRISMVKHGRIGDNYKPEAFYFISVRNPLEQYLSLYRYGCKGMGAIFESLSKSGHTNLYKPASKSFQRWLEFVLSTENAGHLGAEYKAVDTELMGLQTFRFLALSFQHPIPKLKSLHDYDSLCNLYDREKIHSEVIRNESLREDMQLLVTSHPFDFVDTGSAIEYLKKAPSINTSPKDHLNIESVDEETQLLLKQKERFLLERFYPDSM